MTRKNFYKALLGIFVPLTAFGATKKVCYPVKSIWETPQGQYVLALRGELKRLDHWDDLAEDWQNIEDALKNGHMFYEVGPGRQEGKKMLYRIVPAFYSTDKYLGVEYLNISRL